VIQATGVAKPGINNRFLGRLVSELSQPVRGSRHAAGRVYQEIAGDHTGFASIPQDANAGHCLAFAGGYQRKGRDALHEGNVRQLIEAALDDEIDERPASGQRLQSRFESDAPSRWSSPCEIPSYVQYLGVGCRPVICYAWEQLLENSVSTRQQCMEVPRLWNTGASLGPSAILIPLDNDHAVEVLR
jgi:hypothetical protein